MNQKRTIRQTRSTTWLLVVLMTLSSNAAAVDNVMVNAEIKEIGLSQPPIIGMSITPGVEPGVVISPPDGRSGVLPGYRVRHKGVGYLIGVSCAADLSDDCSAYPYREDYKARAVFIRYIQTSDRNFQTPDGSAPGDRWDRTLKRVGGGQIQFSGNDSCVRLPSGWHACIDPMSPARKFDPTVQRLMPAGKAPIDFFFKSKSDK